MELTLEQFKAILPRMARNPNTAANLLPLLNSAMKEAGVDTAVRIAAFIAQVAHESGEFKYWEELASGDAYDTRTDLGNTPEKDGDGRKYKGRGPIQITGRNNYKAAGEALGVDLLNKPELAATPEIGFRVAAWFWTSRKLNALADARNFDAITKKINGGYNGKTERDAFYKKALDVFGTC